MHIIQKLFENVNPVRSFTTPDVLAEKKTQTGFAFINLLAQECRRISNGVKILLKNFVIDLNIPLAAALLILMAILMFSSVWNDSATMDELAHIPSGYSYLKFKDMRLNPEHPPLLKDLSAVPLQFMDLNFPLQDKSWTTDINGQWESGAKFLYESGNDADKVIFWARVFPILLTLLLGAYVFKWAKELYDERAGLLALFLYAFSPTVLAHGRYVTTDIAAAFGIFIAMYYFAKRLSSFKTDEEISEALRFRSGRRFAPFLKNLLPAGATFGIAQSLKFSAFLLIPFFLGLAVLWAFSISGNYRQFFKTAARAVFYAVCVFTAGYILIVWPIYQFHTWNYPAARQAADAAFNLASFGFRPAAEAVVWMSDKPVFRPFAQYLLGVLMVIQRAGGGNTTYFLGEVTNVGWTSYFPAVYLLKETLPFHILTAIALIFASLKIYKSAKEKNNESKITKIKNWLTNHFAETTMLLFIAFYWFMSMRGNLNIGIRHLLPVLPLTYVLVAGKISEWLKPKTDEKIGSWLFAFAVLLKNYLKRTGRSILVGILLLWLALEIILVFPRYLSYFNEIAGGTENGYKYAVDSNYDWGQDLKRLKDFTEKRKIEKIGIDYFGGGSPKYYLGEKFIPWWSGRGEPPAQTWLAVSASFLQSAFGETTKGFVRKPEDSYEWLKKYQPIDRVGYSIFIYYIQ